MPTADAIPPFHGNISFHAQHSPLGAFASFTCGLFGSRGGFGLQIGRPGDQDLYIGIKDGARADRTPLTCLPFFEGAVSDEAERYDVEKKSVATASKPWLHAYARDQITRHYGWGTDRWVTRDFEFAIYTPFFPVPEYGEGRTHQLSVLPAVIAELTVDNTAGTTPKTAIFAMRFPKAGSRLLDSVPGFAWRDELGVRASLEGSKRCTVESFMRWKLDDALYDVNPRHALGSLPGIAMTVPAGEKATLRLALGVYADGFVTTRLRGQYVYTRSYGGLEMVLDTALSKFDHLKDQAQLLDQQLLATNLSADQQFLISHATRSYHGSTQFLDVGGEPFWVVNEGEYCMLNTLDLSVDQMFWELRQHPWLVRNLLDRFVRHYSYVDQVKVPKPDVIAKLKQKHVTQSDEHTTNGEPRVLGELLPMEAFDLRPGGISFTHDMGVHNNFSPAGYSSYELPNLVGCFGYMTCEQLCNWTLMAASYVAHTKDLAWARQNQHTIRACLDSLINRSGDAGYVMYDSSRCEAGSEITTYDSLDHSLAQTRNNLYMAVKCWASYVGLDMLLSNLYDLSAKIAQRQATRCVKSILQHAGPDGIFPAVFEKDNPGNVSRILPAIEGLVYPAIWGEDVSAYANLHKAMAKHTIALLTDPEKRNQFADGGIKLSSTSDNSWMSKIAIFQYVCTDVLKIADDPKIKAVLAQGDAAHVKWMTEGESAYWACSDQFVNGVAKGSKYYPRIVTSVLWTGPLTRKPE